MTLRVIVAVAVAIAIVALPVAEGQESVVEDFVIEPIVIGGQFDGEIEFDQPIVSDLIPGDAPVDAVVADGVVEGTHRAHGGCGHSSGCDCAGSREYLVFDVLFLDRDNATNNQPILVDGTAGLNPGGTVFTTRSMVPTTAPGGSISSVHGVPGGCDDRPTSASKGVARTGTHATTSPAVSSVGRSLRLCTAASIRP